MVKILAVNYPILLQMMSKYSVADVVVLTLGWSNFGIYIVSITVTAVGSSSAWLVFSGLTAVSLIFVA